MANGKPIIPSPYPIIPSPLQVRGIPNLSQVGTAQLPPNYLSTRAGIPSYTQLPQRVGESVMPSAVLTPQQRAAQATQRLAQLTQSRGGGSDVMPVTQQRPRGFFDSLPSPMSPAGQGLTAAATTGLQLSGWQDRPITLGSALGAMGQAGMEAYTAAQEAQRKSKLQEATLALKVAEAMKVADPKITTAMQNLTAAGYDLNTPEGQQAMRDYLKKPTGTSVTVGGEQQDEFDKLAIKAGFDRLKEADKSISDYRNVENALIKIAKTLEGESVTTGRISALTFPFRQALVDAGLASSEEAETIGNEELLRSSIAFIIPRMRVAGSGSTSDREMTMFATAAPQFSSSSAGNRKIAIGMLQAIEYEKKRRNLMDQFFNEKKNLIGFDAYADELQGEVFPNYISGDEEDEKRYEKDLASGKIKKGMMIFNGKQYVIIE